MTIDKREPPLLSPGWRGVVLVALAAIVVAGALAIQRRRTSLSDRPVLGATRPAEASASAVDGDRQLAEDAVRAAVRNFALAMQSGDRGRILQTVSVNPLVTSQSIALQALVALISGRHALADAVQERFGAESAAHFSAGVESALDEADTRRLDVASITFAPITGGSGGAMVLCDGDAGPIILRRSQAGRWQVVLPMIDQIDENPTGRQRPDSRIALLTEQAAAVQVTTSLVRQGRINSADEAEKDLAARMENAGGNARLREGSTNQD